MPTMKTVRLHEYGGPEKLIYEEVNRPVPSTGEILVKVHAVGVNALDWKLRSGMMKDFWPLNLPVTFGSDIAGEVAVLGEGVTDFGIGDTIYTFSPIQGGYAEYVVLPAKVIANKPETLSFDEAAAVPVAATTAWQAIFDNGGLKAGQKVLVHAASGGVGSLAVQFAKWKGAYVIGTASTRNEEFVRSLGADDFVDYTAGPFEDKVSDLDVVFDTVGADTATRSLSVIKPGGALVVIAGGPPDEEAQKRNIRYVHLNAQPSRDILTQVAGLIDSGKVKVHVETVLPLAEAGKAQELSHAGRTRGKIVLQVV